MSSDVRQTDAWREGWQVLSGLVPDVAQGVVDSLQNVAPELADLVVSYGFGQSYSRPHLSARDRQLVTLGALTALGSERQIEVHARLGLAAGLTKRQIVETFIHSAVYCGFPRAISATLAAEGALRARPNGDADP